MVRLMLGLSAAAVLTGGTLPAFDFGQQATRVTDAEWCDDAGSDRDRERFCEVRELAISGPAALTIRDNPNGSIQVTGSDRADTRIRARVVATAGSVAEARSLASEIEVSIDGGRVRTHGPRTTGRRTWQVSYRVETPAPTDLDLETSNGSIRVAGVRSRIRVESANGSLHLTDVSGDVSGRTSNGSVRVELSGSAWNGTGLDVRTTNGSARIDLPEGYSARLIGRTANGRLSVDFPVTVQGRLSRELDVTLGSGGPTLRLETSNGSIRIGRRE